MGKITRRGSLAAAAAVAATLALAPGASAAMDDDDVTIIPPGSSGNENVERIAGTDRIATAVKALEAGAATGVWGDTVVLARSDDFADVLAGAPLADFYDAPVLITPSGQPIDARVRAAIDANGFSNIVIVGGTGAVSESVEAGLVADGYNVNRIKGVDRYETATALAEAAIAVGAVSSEDLLSVYLADGTDFADALAAGAAAADNNGVVLLTAGDVLPDTTRDYMTDTLIPVFATYEILTAGGPADRAADAADVNVDFSYVGKDRFETAVMLAEEYDNVESVTVANGFNYPDAVVAGAFAANQDGPLVLTHPHVLTGSTKDYLFDEIADGAQQVVVFGGPGSVTTGVSAEIEALFDL